MKIALAQLNYHIGNFEANTRKIIEQIEVAQSQGAQLVVFAELAISGYPPRDFLEFDDFIEKCNQSVNEIAQHCNGIAAIVGSPRTNPSLKGKRLYNAALLLADGKVQQQVNKTLLPNYDVFDEYRYFEPNHHFQLVEFQGLKIALTICEDLWNVEDVPMYRINPMDQLMPLAPELIINIAASPFHDRQYELRKSVLSKNAQKYHLPIIYVNHVGAQTELLFDGGSLFMNAQGEIVECAPFFEEHLLMIDITKIRSTFNDKTQHHIALIHDALVMGIKNYFGKLGFKKAILGLSGGIDSAVTLALAAKALGAENTEVLLLPSQYSSDHSINDALQLAQNLNVKHHIVPIQEAYQSFETTLQPYFQGLPFGLAEENLQARIRGVYLMAFSNKFGHILLNTSNKSEAAVGYGTLYGDMNGGLSVLGDLYKTQVFELARYINRETEIIPINTIIKPPSAELRPDQKDSDSLPDYEILDQILFAYIEERKCPSEIATMGFDKPLVDRVLRLVNTNEYKRHQSPPILRVSSKAFGMGRRMPIVGKYLN